jgi:hypothetical protein
VPEVTVACEREYSRVRWPDGAPRRFRRSLAAARLYLNFRWLGDVPEWIHRKKTQLRYDALRADAESLGLL